MVHKFKMEWRSGVAHGVVAIRMIGMMLNGLTVAASACCILCLVAYLGYDRSPDEIQFLLRCFRIIQGILVASLLFDFAFNFKNTIKSTRLIKWIVSVALLVTILPIIYPRPEHPWIVWLDSLLYSNKFTVGVLTAYSTVTLSYGLLTASRIKFSDLHSGGVVSANDAQMHIYSDIIYRFVVRFYQRRMYYRTDDYRHRVDIHTVGFAHPGTSNSNRWTRSDDLHKLFRIVLQWEHIGLQSAFGKGHDLHQIHKCPSSDIIIHIFLHHRH